MKAYNAIYKYGHLYDAETGQRILLKENSEIALVIQSFERDIYAVDPKNDPNDEGNLPRSVEDLKALVESEQYHHFEKVLDRNQHLYLKIKAGDKDEQGKRRYDCCFRVTLLEELYMIWKAPGTKIGEFFLKHNRSCSCVVDALIYGELDKHFFEPIYGSSLSDVYTLTYEMYFSRFGRSGVNIYKFIHSDPYINDKTMEQKRDIENFLPKKSNRMY